MRAVSAHLLLLLASTCVWLCSDAAHIAVPKPDYNFGVFGGHPVNITEVPYMAQFKTKGVKWGGGACIVHQQFLVSAAHGGEKTSSVTVGNDNVFEGENYEIEKVFLHPKYNETTGDYDISVIKLKNKLKFSDRVQPIKMADLSLIPKPGDLLETIGFGETENGRFNSLGPARLYGTRTNINLQKQFLRALDKKLFTCYPFIYPTLFLMGQLGYQTLKKPSERLLKVLLPYVDREKCNEEYENEEIFSSVTKQMICAGGEAGKGNCHGDSGGPLVYSGHLIGIVSWTKPCALENFPTVYAYVPSMIDFIDNVIKNNA